MNSFPLVSFDDTHTRRLKRANGMGIRYGVFRIYAMKGLTSAVLAAIALACTFAQAAFPDRPIRIIVGYAPGGATDIVARTLTEPLSTILGQPVIIENFPGASGGIGAQRAIASAPDGYTVQLGNSTEMVVNALITPNLPYNVETGLAPVAYVGSAPSIMVGKKDLPPNTLQELIVYMREAPQPTITGTPGLGTPQHLALELFKTKTGVSVVPVHYKGGAPVVADVMGGHVDVAIMSLVSVLPHMAANRFKTYGVTTKDRSPLVPDVPAMSEVQGLEGFDIAPWFGFYVPIRTPEAIQIQLQDAILTVLRDPKVRAKLEQQGVTVTPEDRKVFRARIRNELRDLEPIVKAADIKAAN